MIFNLIQDLADALAVMPKEHPHHRILTLLDEAIRRDVHFIARHPTTLFQCLWNSCWWYDCPEAAGHYDRPVEGWGRNGPPWERLGVRLCRLLESWRQAKEAALSGFAWLRSLRPPLVHLGTGLRAVMPGHERDVLCVAFSADGRKIVSGSWDATARVWDADSGQELLRLGGHAHGVDGVAFSPDSRRIVTGGRDHMVRVWNADHGAELACLRGHASGINSVAFSPNGRRIVSGSGDVLGQSDNTVRIWDADTGALLACLQGPTEVVTAVAYAPDGRRIASAEGNWRDQCVRLWDANSGQQLACLRGHAKAVTSVAFSPDGRRLVSGAKDCTVRVWDVQTGAERACFRGHQGFVQSVAFSPDAARIASAGGGNYVEAGLDADADDTVRVWNAHTGALLACFRGHEGNVNSVAYSPDGRRVVSGARDATVRLWDPTDAEPMAPLRGHNRTVECLAFSPDGVQAATGGWDKSVRTWDVTSGTERNRCLGHRSRVAGVAYSLDNQRLVSWSTDGTLRIWDAVDGSQRANVVEHEGEIECVALSPDRRWIASGGIDHRVRLWDAQTGQPRGCFHGHTSLVACLAFSPDSQQLASGSWDCTVRVWSLDGTPLACLPGHDRNFGEGVKSVAFSPDGRLLVSGGSDKTVRLWDLATWRPTLLTKLCRWFLGQTCKIDMRRGLEVACLRGHDGDVDAVAFSADGLSIFSQGGRRRDYAIRLWDARSHACTATIKGEGDVAALAAGPSQFPFRVLRRDSETAIEAAADGRLVAWFPATSFDLIRLHSAKRLDPIQTHRHGRIWAATARNHLFLFTLEGDVSEPHSNFAPSRTE